MGGNTLACSIDWSDTPTVVGVLLRGLLTTKEPGREIGITTVGANRRFGHFIADDSLSADKLEFEELFSPIEGG